MMRERKDLRPGEIFVVSGVGLLGTHQRGPFVVIDKINEVHFFEGSKWIIGDVAPNFKVEVIS